jgi:hypothetical protein
VATHAFWTSAEVIQILSGLTALEMEVALPYEMGHTNVQLGHGGREGLKCLKVIPSARSGRMGGETRRV